MGETHVRRFLEIVFENKINNKNKDLSVLSGH